MKHANRLVGVILITLGLGYGAPGYAQENDSGPAAGTDRTEACRVKSGPGRHAARLEQIEKRLTALHDDLKLNSDQETAWNDWSSHVRKQITEIRNLRPDFEALQKLPAPEKMERWLAFGKERQGRLEQGLGVTRAFYGVLTPEQRQIFDKAFDAFGPGGWKARHRTQS